MPYTGRPTDNDDQSRFWVIAAHTYIIGGTPIYLPIYDGIQWRFPTVPDPCALQSASYWFFTWVQTVQVLCLAWWYGNLIYRIGWVFSLISIPFMVPFAVQLEETYGKHYGTAYSCLQSMFFSFRLVTWYMLWSPTFDPSPGVFLFGFCALMFLMGHALAMAETRMGRLLFASVTTSIQTGIWLYMLVNLIQNLV